MSWFSTKKTRLRFLNIFVITWFVGAVVIGAPLAFRGLQKGEAHDALYLLAMLALGVLGYGFQRIALHLLFRDRTAAPEEIEVARKMLYGDKKND